MRLKTKADPYESDLHAWSFDQAQKLRERRYDSIDPEHIAEELESLGKSEQDRITRHFTLYLMHRLKWDYQPGMRTSSWTRTINEQHRQAIKVFSKNPSLRPHLKDLYEDAYLSARVEALNETGLEDEAMPLACPYPVEVCFPEFFEAIPS